MNSSLSVKFYLTVFLIVFGCAIIGNRVVAGNDKFSYEDIIRLEKVVNKVSEFYVEEIDSKDLVGASIEGLRTILDPHTAYFTEKDYNNLKVSTEGEFGGLGITIAVRDHILTIISPLVGTPAFKMGLQAGDRIMKIEGVSTKGITVNEAVDKLRGKKGTEVTIQVYREGVVEPMDFTIVRDIIQIKSVPYAGMLNDSVGYVKVTQFSKSTSDDLEDKIVSLNSQGAKALILDLRNNPGGLLNQAIAVSDFFLKKNELVVFTKGRTRSQNKKYLSEKKPLWKDDKQIVVLVNAGSASASEIVAGAVQDHDRGIIMGQTTFGKGSVQTILPLDAKKYALKLTTAYYYTPSGRCINKPENAAKVRADAAKSDTAKSDSSDYFLTDSGRKVFAAGGIHPDVEAKGNTYNRYVRELERKTMFFKFIIKERNSIKKNNKVDLNFKVSSALRKKFNKFVYTDTSFIKYKSATHLMLDELTSTFDKELEAAGDTLPNKINNEIEKLAKNLENVLSKRTKLQFGANGDYIDYALKRELLQAVLGDSIRVVHELARDLQVKKALDFLDKPSLYAEALTRKK